jgi:hypothetical protein
VNVELHFGHGPDEVLERAACAGASVHVVFCAFAASVRKSSRS